MRLPQLSIQNSLLFALALLLLLLVMSSLVSWLAFDRVNSNQRALLENSLPSMRSINQAVDTGAQLLNLGDALSTPLSASELFFLERQAKTLFIKIAQDMDDLGSNTISPLGSTSLGDNTRYLMQAIEQLLGIQRLLVDGNREIEQEKSQVFGAIQRLLIDIKLIESGLSLALIKAQLDQKEALRSQLATLTSQRFGAQRIGSLINEVLLLDKAP